MADRTMVDYTQKIKPYFEGIAPIEPITTAAHTHAVGDVFYLNGTKVKCTVAISVGDTIAIGTNVEEADDVESEIQALTNNLSDEIETRAMLGAHNLLPINVNTQTINGVTFTVTRDNSGKVTEIDANGTNDGTDSSRFYIFGTESTFKPLSVSNVPLIANGVNSGSSSTYFMAVHTSNSTSGQYAEAHDFYNGDENIGAFAYYKVYLVIRSGVTVNHVKFYPMLRLATDNDETWQPYAKTNRELTEDTNAIEPMLNVLGAKNLLKINDISQTTSGVTVSINNGVITLNGTSTGQITLTLLNDYNSPIKSGSYIFNGLDDGSSNTISMVLNYYNSQGAEQPSAVAVNGDTPATIPADYNGHLKIYLIIANGQTFNNKVVKPMIRDASIKNADYAPYAMTNRELTENVLSTISTKFIKIPTAELNDTYNPITIADELVATGSSEIVYVQVGANSNTTNPKLYCPLQYTIYEIRHTGDTVTLNAVAYNPDLSNAIYTIGRSRNGSWGTWQRTTMTAVT